MPELKGLYAITPAGKIGLQPLLAKAEQAILGGARMVQYRNKGANQQRRLSEAGALLSLCREHRVPLIINDDIALTRAIGADGIHLGRHDTQIAQAREALGSDTIIGASCYNDFSLARAAADAKADYVAFGSFFPSRTKPGAVAASQSLLRRAKTELALPVVAIGGITAQNASPLIDAGADMLAVIQGVFSQTDIRQAATAFAELFEN